MDLPALRQKLAAHKQSHLLAFWEELTAEQQTTLYDELTELDLEEVMEYFEKTVASQNETAEKLDDRMQPLPTEQCGSILTMTDGEKERYERSTYEQVSAGKMGILLLAGGQGTRLGVDYPKGMYDVGLPSGKTLFQLQAERLLKLERLAEEHTGKKGHIAWYIMTSATTVKPTTEFFEKNGYFGLDSANVIVFQQGTLPCFTFKGEIILNSKYELSRAPDGNGGLYRALRHDGILDDMKRRGLEYIQLFCVDNLLVRVGDPIFTGYCIAKGAKCGNKVVPKTHPTETVGITCKVDGKFKVVEYSEITSKSAEKRNPDGSLMYSAANLCIHFFTLDFLARVVNEHERELVHHVAKKKIPYMDAESGKLVLPERPNGIKMEKFVFDVFQFADENFVVWECVREEEFAPLKNAPGAADSSPTHCRDALFALHQKYVMAAGGSLVDKEGKRLPQMRSPLAPKETNNNNNNNNSSEDDAINGDENGIVKKQLKKKKVVVCEISPLVSYAGEGLERFVAGKSIQVPTSQIGLH